MDTLPRGPNTAGGNSPCISQGNSLILNGMKTPRFCLALAAILAAAPAHAQEVAPVPAPTIIKSAPYTITTPGYYQLGANLSYAGNSSIANDAIITVAVSNVTLDFGGHFISGPATNTATTLFGVYCNERGNINIINGTISHCWIGIELFGNGSATSLNYNQRVNNMLVTHCYAVGIDLTYANNSHVTNCNVSDIGGTTAPVYNSLDYSGIAVGIGFEYGGGKGSYADNNTISNITAGVNSGYGIFCFSASATGNTIDTVTGSGAAYGIQYPIFALGNKISNATTGIANATKYKDNLTSNCPSPFSGGTAVGTND